MSTRHFRILFNDMQRRAAPGTRKASKKIGSEFRIFGQAYTAKKIRMKKKMFRPHSDKKSIHERSVHAYQYITSRSLFPCPQCFIGSSRIKHTATAHTYWQSTHNSGQNSREKTRYTRILMGAKLFLLNTVFQLIWGS